MEAEKRRKRAGGEGESGEIMLEAVIILVPVLVLLFAMLSLSFLFYEEAVMNTVANEIASEVARNFKFPNLPMDDHDVAYQKSNLTGTEKYRMSFRKGTIATKQGTRAANYLGDRLKLSSLGLHPQAPDISTEVHFTGIGRAYVKVKVSRKTDFFLSGILDMVGVSEQSPLFSATAYAECTDFTEYASMTNFNLYLSEEVLDPVAGPFGSLYKSVKNLVYAVKDLLDL